MIAGGFRGWILANVFHLFGSPNGLKLLVLTQSNMIGQYYSDYKQKPVSFLSHQLQVVHICRKRFINPVLLQCVKICCLGSVTGVMPGALFSICRRCTRLSTSLTVNPSGPLLHSEQWKSYKESDSPCGVSGMGSRWAQQAQDFDSEDWCLCLVQN